MRSDSATGSSPAPALRLGKKLAQPLALLLALAVAACSFGGGKKPESGKSILNVKQGDTTIQVTESTEDGYPVVRINTNYKGEDHSIVMSIDQPVYDVEIPLTVEQIAPQTAAAAKSSPAGNFEDLLINQYLEKAQESMLAGDYQAALRQVNLVLLTRPDHVPAHSMKGSIYYAMGNYQLANEEWQRVLTLDPSNQEVKSFMDFMKNRQSAPQPPLPGAPTGPGPGAQPGSPGAGRPGAAPGPAAPGRAAGAPAGTPANPPAGGGAR